MLLSALINVATTISISAAGPTTLVFNEPISFASIGKVGDYSLFINNNKNVLVINPLKDLKKSEMIIITENRNFQFKIQITNNHPESYFQITEGKVNSSFTLLKKEELFEVYEGVSSLMLKNISDKSLTINDEVIKPHSITYLPKGGSIYIDSERVL